MSERNDESVRDFDTRGDLGEESHSAFADNREGASSGSDDRLGMRGRNPGREGGELLDAVDADRKSGASRSEESDAG
jgi:hypothetical protein